MNQLETPENRLDVLLEDYLVKNTNFAILLTASWGAGKTYYLKNHFFNRIIHTGYKPILVSLFGIKSVDDIKDRIFAELYPFLENKHLKTTKTVLKVLVKSADITKLIGDGFAGSMVDNISLGVKELKQQKKEHLELNKLLICFDDLERASPEMLNSSEILGYINSLVEDDNVKIIIIANEGKMESGKYREVKEKTIGHTIHFDQNFNDVFLNILDKDDQPIAYRNFLKSHQQVIFDFLSVDENYEKGKLNYRTLTYFISYFSQVFEFVRKGFKIEDIDNNKDQLLSALIKFSLFVCNEYKKGFFSFVDRQGFDDPTSLMVQRYYGLQSKEPETKLSNTIRAVDAYYSKEELIFYDSIYNYLTGGDFFDKGKFLSELKYQYHVVDENVSPAYKVYNKLSNANYRNLTDQEYKSLTSQMRNFAIKGHYQLHDYISVLYYVLRHGNILKLNPDKFTHQLLLQIKKKVSTHLYNPIIDRYMSVSEEAEFYKWSIQLQKEILAVNTKSGMIGRTKVVAQMENDLIHDYSNFYDKLIKEVNTPFGVASFSGFNPAKFFKAFTKGDNAQKSMMVTLFHVVYAPKNGNNSVGDLEFLKDLQAIMIRDNKSLNSKSISGFLISELRKTVNEAIVEAQRYHPV